jgi:cytosine permease
MRTGLPLYIVGTSTFGATGGFLMPGFLMGVLQFGWLGVNVYFSSLALAAVIPVDPRHHHGDLGACLAAFVGLKGIQYVAKVATYLPLIPLVVLVWLSLKTAWAAWAAFDPGQACRHAPGPSRRTRRRRWATLGVDRRDPDLRGRLLRDRRRRGRRTSA